VKHLRVLGGLTAFCVAAFLSACGGGGGDGGNDPAPNRAPSANAGADQSVFKAVTVTLDASASTDPDSNPLTYRWTQTAGPAVTLSSSTASRPTFTAPGASGVLTFSVVVNDAQVDSTADTVQVSVTNRVPAANAGIDGTVEAGQFFTLDALTSTDPDTDALTYTWTQLSGTPVTLTAVANGRARFTAPTSVGTLSFGVVANDGESSSAQDVVAVAVVINAVNQPPVAQVYGDYTLSKRAIGYLNGNGFDPDDFSLTYRWTQVSGPAVTITDASTPFATFTAPAVPAVLAFDLVVSDRVSVSPPARVTVTVANSAPALYVNSILPANPRTLDDVTVDVDVADDDQDPVTLSYVWTRNGTAVAQVTGAVYPASLTTRGDVIAVTITGDDGTVASSVDATTAIEDTPPVLSASASTVVNYGDSVSFQIIATGDDDGDPVGNYLVTLGPSGFQVDSAGQVSWLAHMPMFDDHANVAWSVEVQGTPAATLSGTIRVNHAARQLPLMRSASHVPQHRELVVVADLDANGVDDMLLSDGRTLGVMSAGPGGFVQSWTYPLNLAGEQAGISAIAAGNVNGSADLEIFAAGDSVIRKLDGVTRRVTSEYTNTDVTMCYALRVADLDGDGARELVCLANEESLYNQNGASLILVLNAADLSLKGSITLSGLGSSMDVGNVDADGALEIVTSNGYVFDGATLQNEWAFGPRFGNVLETGDVDGDGVDEIVAMNYTDVRVFSAVSRTQRATFTSGYCCGLAEIRVGELGGDARREVLIGDSQWGNVSAYRFNPATQLYDPVFSISAQQHGVSGIGVGNVDADGNVEVVWGSNVSSSGGDVLVVAEMTSPTTIAVDWLSTTSGQVDGPFDGGILARTAAGTRRLMFLSPRSMGGYAGAKLFAMDPVSGSTQYSSEIGSNWANASGIDVADTDADGIDEVFLSSADLYNAFFATYDFASDLREWTSPVGFSQAQRIQHADVTHDGNAEFITMGVDGRVTIFNVSASNIVWQSPQLQGLGADVSLADLDGDGELEVIALTDVNIYVFGRTGAGSSYTQRALVAQQGGQRLLVADTDGDAEHEIFVITSSYYYGTSELRSFTESLAPLNSATLTVRATNLALEPSAFPRKNLLISTGQSNCCYSATYSEIWAIDPRTGTGVWRSPQLPGDFSRNSLHPVDVDQDGQYELAFGTYLGAFVTR
jgi:hypothetical protein